MSKWKHGPLKVCDPPFTGGLRPSVFLKTKNKKNNPKINFKKNEISSLVVLLVNEGSNPCRKKMSETADLSYEFFLQC
jgi:hypothetical protein